MWLLCFIVVVLVSSGASTTGKMTCGAGDDLCATPSDRHILKRHSGQPESMVSVKSASCHQQQVSGCGGKERLELGPCRMLANGPKAKALGVAVPASFPHRDNLAIPSWPQRWCLLSPFFPSQLGWHVVHTLHTTISALTRQEKGGCNFAINAWIDLCVNYLLIL